jgi:acyl-CoA dehydrogenase
MSAAEGGGSELRTLLADTVTRLFTDLVTKERLESSEKGVWPDELWRALEEGGLTLPLVAEDRGGAGGTWGDAHVVVRAAGRHAAPVPLAETVVASALLAGARLDVPTGPLTLAPVRSTETLALTRAGSAWRLSGTATRVPWGRAARHVVVVAEVDGHPTVGLVAASAAEAVADRNVALEPRDTLTWRDAPVLAAAPAAPGVGADVVGLHGALVRSAQMAGALEFLLEQSVRYTGERKQFGRPLSAFQVIQHNLAILAGHVAAAGIAAEQAFRAAERGDARFEIAAAKIRTGEAAGIGASIAHQAHGAIGFTYEHSLHFATRRLWSWRAEFGSESRWSEALGRDVAALGGAGLWPYLTSRRAS